MDGNFERSRKRKGVAAETAAEAGGLDGARDFRSAPARQQKGNIIEYQSDSEDEEIERKKKAKYAVDEDDDPGAALPGPDTDTTNLKMYVQQQKSAEAETMLFGKSKGKAELEHDAPEDIHSYEKDMGYTIEPFNTRDEREKGQFDKSGFYMRERDADDDDVQDPWLAEMDENQSGPAKVAVPSSMKVASDTAPAPIELYSHYEIIMQLLKPGESVTKALRRLKPVKEAAIPKWKQKRLQKGEDAPASSSAAAESKEAANTFHFNKLLEATHTLLDAGVVEIYSYSYDELLERSEKLKEEEEKEERKKVLASSTLWEFAWSKEPGAEFHGPYTSEEMNAWKIHGMFSAERVAYAKKKEEDMFSLEEPELREAHTIDYE
mmetsp:Transcript_109053/g.188871  ORF Transcript_109053/g.188871 Transcript_109053/m.188871 type:complete len:378 (-) Transcript_109053:577-1710(-)